MNEHFLVPTELEMDWEKALRYGIKWVKDYFLKAKINTAVIGISGGSDSALTAYITARAIGRQNVTGIMLPEDGVTTGGDLAYANEVIRSIGILGKEINITPFISRVSESDKDLLKQENRIAYANVKARTRMLLLYKEANKTGALVAGTDDRSENILGYFTKYGDGGVDINVPEYLYKTQVRGLLKYISKKEGLPIFARIAEEAPSPRLWAGQTAEGELKQDYVTIDRILFYIKDRRPKLSDKKIVEILHVEKDVIDSIRVMEQKNRHKNCVPPSPVPIRFKR